MHASVKLNGELKVTPSNPFRTGFVATAEDGAVLTLEKGVSMQWKLFYSPAPRAIEIATQMDKQFAPPKNPLLLAEGDGAKQLVVTYPTNTTASSSTFLQPKYSGLRAVAFVGFDQSFPWGFDVEDDADWPNGVEEIEQFFEYLPSGFIRNPYFGLGLNWDIRFIANAIEKLGGGITLKITKGANGQPTFDESTYSVSARMFDETRRAIKRAHDKALAVALREKIAFSNNTLLNPINPQNFPEITPVYEKDAIVRAMGNVRKGDLELSPNDQKAVVAAAKRATRKLSASSPAQLLELSQEIELVTLEVLVERIETMLGKRLTEGDWQKFFSDNQFVLRLAFGFPVTKIGEQFSVGSIKFDGTGNKISDFAVKAAATGNLGLIEIKTPHTQLLETRAYRGELYAPSKELAGATNQVLDQAYHLQQNISGLKNRSGIWDVESYAVNGLVIAGRTPTERPQVKSFELYRNSLKSVTIVTFDEMLQKLKHLLDVLRPGPVEES